MGDELISIKMDELISNQKIIIELLSKMYSLLSKYDNDYQNEVASIAKEE